MSDDVVYDQDVRGWLASVDVPRTRLDVGEIVQLGRARTRRRQRRVLAVAAIVALVGAVSISASLQDRAVSTTPPPVASDGSVVNGWRELPGSPLSPRGHALGLWTGREVLLIGGTEGPVCPPNARCTFKDGPPLADGAAVDPATGRWRRIADAPVPFRSAEWDGSQGVVVDQTAYLLLHDGLFAYDVGKDQWHQVTVPFDLRGRALLAAGDTLVAYLQSPSCYYTSSCPDRVQSVDYAYEADNAQWTALPADPLGGGRRTMTWTGHEFVLFDHPLAAQPGGELALVRAVVLDPATGSWQRLPDSQILWTSPWVVADGVLINPTLGGSDDEPGYRLGGQIDPAAGIWSPLPDPPAGARHSAGARTDSTAIYTAHQGSVLDTATGIWQEVPALPDGELHYRTLVAAGTDMVVFGGTDLVTGGFVNNSWIWSPGR